MTPKFIELTEMVTGIKFQIVTTSITSLWPEDDGSTWIKGASGGSLGKPQLIVKESIEEIKSLLRVAEIKDDL